MKQERKESGSRPGWRGPGSTPKITQKSKAPKPTESRVSGQSITQRPQLSIELQQQLLNTFKVTFPTLVEGSPDSIKPLLQEVKQALFERDFDRAFGRKDYLEAYAFRWSPSRSLCYLSILIDLFDNQNAFMVSIFTRNSANFRKDEKDIEASAQSRPKPMHHVVCLGGGAAEVVAFGGLLSFLNTKSNPWQDIDSKDESLTTEATVNAKMPESPPPPNLHMLLIDTAAWDNVVDALTLTLASPLPLSKYASATAIASNKSILPLGALSATFQRLDLLSMTTSQLKESLGHHHDQEQQPLLITLLFTLNELYTSSIATTTTFLLKLTAAAMQGTLLLVVDSPGSYSEAVVGKESKKYPMQWLMDRTLLGERKDGREGDENEPQWEKIEEDQSRWFRMPQELKYPISLENMRYQIHLFKRL